MIENKSRRWHQLLPRIAHPLSLEAGDFFVHWGSHNLLVCKAAPLTYTPTQARKENLLPVPQMNGD
ncbi:hypothetical protein ES703_70237 [subsurface metagenome]